MQPNIKRLVVSQAGGVGSAQAEGTGDAGDRRGSGGSHKYGGGGVISCGENFGGRNVAPLAKRRPLAKPKPHTASRTHCTAKAPGLHQAKISQPALKAKISHKIISAPCT